jgi:NADH:ubiquinone oxidoreductase subunit D
VIGGVPIGAPLAITSNAGTIPNLQGNDARPRVISDGGPNPYRFRMRDPSFVSLQSTAMMSVNRYVGDMIVVVGSLDGVMGEADR